MKYFLLFLVITSHTLHASEDIVLRRTKKSLSIVIGNNSAPSPINSPHLRASPKGSPRASASKRLSYISPDTPGDSLSANQTPSSTNSSEIESPAPYSQESLLQSLQSSVDTFFREFDAPVQDKTFACERDTYLSRQKNRLVLDLRAMKERYKNKSRTLYEHLHEKYSENRLLYDKKGRALDHEALFRVAKSISAGYAFVQKVGTKEEVVTFDLTSSKDHSTMLLLATLFSRNQLMEEHERRNKVMVFNILSGGETSSNYAYYLGGCITSFFELNTSQYSRLTNLISRFNEQLKKRGFNLEELV